MKTKVLMVSAKRHGGKDTTCNFICQNATEIFNKHDVKKGVKKYAFADELKKTVSECFDIPLEDCYSEEGKNKLVPHILWENLPHFNDMWLMTGDKVSRGPMKVREILQQFGTEIMRKIWAPIWVNKCKKLILKENPYFACISDWRFPDEDLSVCPDLEVKTIRLSRDVNDPNDEMSKHSSEVALDNYNFDANINNQILTINQTNQTVASILKGFGWC